MTYNKKAINKDMNTNNPQDKKTMSNDKPDDNLGLNMSGHILIRDKETGEVLANKRA